MKQVPEKKAILKQFLADVDSKGLKRADAGRLIGVTAPVITHYRNGKALPSSITLKKMIKYLGKEQGLVAEVPTVGEVQTTPLHDENDPVSVAARLLGTCTINELRDRGILPETMTIIQKVGVKINSAVL